MSIENVMFPAGGGFVFGAVAGYAIKKVMKIAAIVIGLFVIGLLYLSYKGWIDVKSMEMENATRTILIDVAGQIGHAINNTASQFTVHSITVEAAAVYAGSYIWIKERIIGMSEGCEGSQRILK